MKKISLKHEPGFVLVQWGEKQYVAYEKGRRYFFVRGLSGEFFQSFASLERYIGSREEGQIFKGAKAPRRNVVQNSHHTWGDID